jgi:CHASE3 domain sensor protein
MLKRIKENFISLSLTILIVLILFNSGLIFYNRTVMVQNYTLQKQTEEVRTAWAQIFESNLRRMDLGLRGYALTRNEQLLEPYLTGKRDMPGTLKRIDSLLLAQQLDTLYREFQVFKPKVDAYVSYAEEMKMYAQHENLTDFLRAE